MHKFKHESKLYDESLPSLSLFALDFVFLLLAFNSTMAFVNEFCLNEDW